MTYTAHTACILPIFRLRWKCVLRIGGGNPEMHQRPWDGGGGGRTAMSDLTIIVSHMATPESNPGRSDGKPAL